jgi:hypothetical protein
MFLFATAACTTGDPGTGDTPTCGDGVCQASESEASCPADCTSAGDQWDQQLNSRVTDYNAALRIASLRLTGKLPTLADLTSLAAALDEGKKAAYEALITKYMAMPEFKTQMLGFWRDTFKQGGSAVLDTAPILAAKLSVENGSYMDLFTASSGNCPTFNATTGVFAAAECTNGGPKAGVLTNPGVMAQFYSNFAFRRTRWVQETFACTAFPAEVSATPTDVGAGAPYTGVWDFTSIAGTASGGRVDFRDTSATICANCHSSINHIAPLFANYDITGTYQPTISVTTPLDGAPLAKISDYLPPGHETDTAWRMGKPAADLTALGAQMAQDPDVAACGVARMWNWALGKTDIVDTLQQVPNATIQAQIDAFTQSGYKLNDLIFAVYTSDDFVKF